MTIDELIALARADINDTCNDTDDLLRLIEELKDAVLSLLAPDKPCIADAADVVSVDSDGYVTIHAQRDLRPDEARWAAVEILRAADAAEGEGK